MTKEELKQRLIKEDIPEMYYKLDGSFMGDEYCLEFNNTQWEVYYSERGNKNQLKAFDNELDACNYFYHWLIERLTKQGII